MNIYILSDMEGTAGVSVWDQVEPDHPKYQQARRWMTQEINAAAQGAFAAGAKLVLVHDTHMAEHNLDVDLLDPRVEYIMGGGGSPWAELDGSFDAFFLIGAHAKAGTPAGNLRHTWSPGQWVDLKIQGRSVGEIGLFAAGAAERGVPCLLVSGDEQACAEAADLMPGIVQARVKKGLDWQSARMIAPPNAQEMIRACAQEACRSIDRLKPLSLAAAPVDIEIILLKEDKGRYYASSRTEQQLQAEPRVSLRASGNTILEAFDAASAAHPKDVP